MSDLGEVVDELDAIVARLRERHDGVGEVIARMARPNRSTLTVEYPTAESGRAGEDGDEGQRVPARWG